MLSCWSLWEGWERFMCQRLILVFATVLGVLATTDCAEADRRPRRRPNILFAFADDQSWVHTSFHGDPNLQTPNFDRIAREGVYFTHCFSACPSCTPSRSAVLAGQDIWRLKQAGVLYGSIPKDVPLFPLLLSDAGYHVGYTGKGWVPGDPFASVISVWLRSSTRRPAGYCFWIRII